MIAQNPTTKSRKLCINNEYQADEGKKIKKKERRKEKERDSREFNYNLDSIIFTNFTFFFSVI